MPDFTSSFWPWFIGIVTIISIIAVFCLVVALSKRNEGDEKNTVGHVWDGNLEELNTPLPRWWLIMFMVTLVWAVAYLIIYPGLGSYSGLINWTSVGQFEEEMAKAESEYGPIYKKFSSIELAKLVDNEEAVSMGERLYASYCTTCHGSDARGALGYPNLRDDDWLYGGKPEDIKATILNGRRGAMPAWKGILDSENIFNVLSYVESLAGREVDSISASLGKEVFQTNCAVCHGIEGRGNYVFGAPNLTDDIWLYGGSQKNILEVIELGKNGNMPAHKDFLGEDKAHVLAAYIYGLSK